jgi:hypothetical protein
MTSSVPWSPPEQNMLKAVSCYRVAWRGLPHARARERVVPISELVFGTLTQNRSSLEPSLGFAAIVGSPCIVDRVPYVQALEEPKRDPKRFAPIALAA